MPDADLDLLHSAIMAQFLDLEGPPCRARTESWDAGAPDVGGRLVVTSARDEELGRQAALGTTIEAPARVATAPF